MGKARRRTRGSSESSRAARRYSATNSGLLRIRRIIVSSCETLDLRFISFPSSPCNRSGMTRLLRYPRPAYVCVRHKEAMRSMVQSLRNRRDSRAPNRSAVHTNLAKRLAVGKIPSSDSIDSGRDLGLSEHQPTPRTSRRRHPYRADLRNGEPQLHLPL